ncbi:MAG: dockerin type I repeat-containing protein, partial [Clostridia bacterium]|nr:dockerin type I repeat-containing protein [Clostridia bacterium]
DVNGDGDPDVIDYLLLKRYSLGAVAVKEDVRFRMDLDGDGEIGARDYFLLKKRILAK